MKSYSMQLFGSCFFDSTSFSGVSSRLRVSIVRALLLLCSIPGMDGPVLLIHSPVEGPLDCFQIWAIRNKAAVDLHVQVFV